MTIDVVALVPMRHVSERVAGKNYRDFNGQPLFHHIIATLLDVSRIRAIVIDTDSAHIRQLCEAHFPSVVCVERPVHLRDGAVPMTDVLRRDAELVPSDWYLQTHSTNPLLRGATIDQALDRLEAAGSTNDSLFGVTRWQTRLYDASGRPMNHDPRQLLRTQDLPPVFEENSNLYVYRRDTILAGSRIGTSPILFEIDPLEAIDIDDEAHFLLAEAVHRTRGRGG